MADVTAHTLSAPTAISRKQLALGFVLLAVVLTVARYAGVLPDWLHRLPEAVIPPFATWLDAFFEFIKGSVGVSEDQSGKDRCSGHDKGQDANPVAQSRNCEAQLCD